MTLEARDKDSELGNHLRICLMADKKQGNLRLDGWLQGILGCTYTD